MILFEPADDGFATLTMNRPKLHNAFSDVVIRQFADAIEQARATPGLRGVFVRGAGKSFCAGGDLEWMKRAANYSREENRADALVLSNMLHAISTLPVPTIALVHGTAMGGGVGVISACDIAVGVRGAMFALSEVKLGLLPATISPYVIGRIGPSHARRFFVTGERFDGAKAHEIGLLHEVVDDAAGLEEWAAKWRKELTGASPTGVAASKALVHAVAPLVPLPWEAGSDGAAAVMADTADRLADQRMSEEGIEGITAFLEKRRPSWNPKA